MAFRLNGSVLGGELINTSSWSTHGWLELRGRDTLLALELTGDMEPDLKGRHIRFALSPNPEGSYEPEPVPEGLLPHQIGVTGNMTAESWVRTFDCPVSEFLARCEEGDPPPTTWRRRLYLEWYSQNGRVVIELADPVLEYLDGEEWKPLPMATPKPPDWNPGDTPRDSEDGNPSGIGGAIIRLDEEGRATSRSFHIEPQDPDPDPAEALQRELDRQARQIDRALGGDDDDEDDELLGQLEMMDRLIETEPVEPLLSVFEARTLPHPDEVPEEEVEPLLKGLLVEMAMHNIALHVCEHFTPRDTYRLLVDHLIQEEGFHPEIQGSGWTQNFMTSEYCPECEAEAERKFQEYERERERRRQAGLDPDGRDAPLDPPGDLPF